MVLALGTAILMEAFPPTERGRAMGIGGTMIAIGIVTGPVLGGFIVDVLSWHWIFFVNVPVGALGIYLVLRYVQDIRPPGRERFDFTGAVTLFFSLLSLLLALTVGQQIGFTRAPILGLFALWLVLLIAFLLIESIVTYPMIDMGLFRNPSFRTNLVIGFAIFVALDGVFFLMPFYLEDMLGYPPYLIGLLLSVSPIAMGTISPLSGRLSDRVGPRRLIIVGLVVMVAGLYSISRLTLHTTILGYILRLVLVDSGFGIFQPPYGSAVMGAVPPSRLGIASGLMHIVMSLGQTVGIAVLGTLWAGRVFARSGTILEGGATEAPPAIQMAALNDTYLITTVVALLALGLAVWNLARKRSPDPIPGAGPSKAA
jgi:EmrB/QacA subfamily drug resistance transporter